MGAKGLGKTALVSKLAQVVPGGEVDAVLGGHPSLPMSEVLFRQDPAALATRITTSDAEGRSFSFLLQVSSGLGVPEGGSSSKCWHDWTQRACSALS